VLDEDRDRDRGIRLTDYVYVFVALLSDPTPLREPAPTPSVMYLCR
jgi:hypothetical protein